MSRRSLAMRMGSPILREHATRSCIHRITMQPIQSPNTKNQSNEKANQEANTIKTNKIDGFIQTRSSIKHSRKKFIIINDRPS